MAYYDVVGLIGVLLILLAYGLLQGSKLSHSTLTYSVMNGLGAVLILWSLAYEFNLSAVLIESAWLIISVFGIARWFYSRSSCGKTID